ncbi:hypothetical protein ILUMI_05621 [Ignelater luminosus]|uniref:Peroxisomal leader peptide-processing protease n=1 Tax=Ignelater luminosus TaxID=2038154 RepID=A0A8K0D7D8_IGNLU|nr:hypothetical protein ILUMI_05621 [Ignelater luminosus]
MMPIHGVLVEYEDTDNNEIYTNSGILFEDKFVIITGNVLMPYLKSNANDLNAWLLNIQPGKLNFSPFSAFSSKPQVKIVFKKENSPMRFKQAEVISLFVCKNILNSSSRYLHDWAIDFDDKQYQAKQFLSLFFILKIINDNNVSEIDLNVALIELLKNVHKWHTEIGKEVFIESTPFGNREFLNSYSQGVISNIAGENSCFLLTDCPSAPGSEGCPLFIKAKSKIRYPIGIVISCLNWWKGEWIGLTLCANLVPLLEQLVPLQSGLKVDVHFKHETHVHRNLLCKYLIFFISESLLFQNFYCFSCMFKFSGSSCVWCSMGHRHTTRQRQGYFFNKLSCYRK